MKYRYWTDCVGMVPDWGGGEMVRAIVDHPAQRKISYATFARRADLDQLREWDHPAMYRISSPSNWTVSFHRSKLPSGKPVYYFKWSGIEHFFVPEDFDPQEEAAALRSVNPVVLQDYAAYCEDLSKAYDKAPAIDPKELWRWKKLEEHIQRFWKRITRKLDVQFVPGQPYDTAEEMRDEVARTGVLKISTDFNEHPIFDPETNLRFRAVHDYVVHILPGEAGPDFSEKGEIKAYNLHRRLAPPDTWPALFTEVAAQACYANARGEFPEQKVAVIPGFDYYNVGLAANPKKLKARLLR